MMYKIEIPQLRRKLVATLLSLSGQSKTKKSAKATGGKRGIVGVDSIALITMFSRFTDNLEKFDIPTLTYLSLQWTNLLSVLQDPSFDWRTLSLEKGEDIMSFQNMYIYKNYDVTYRHNTSHQARFYEKDQILVLMHGQNVYIVKILVPSTDQAGLDKFRTSINKFIGSLKIYREL